MAAERAKRHDIPFPFEPYPVQQELMEAVYDTMDAGGVGVFESPTGTGKSLSLICSSLHWLLNGGGQRAARAAAETSLLPLSTAAGAAATTTSKSESSSFVSSSTSSSSSPNASRTAALAAAQPSWVTEFEEQMQTRRVEDILAEQQDTRTKLVKRLAKLSASEGPLAVELKSDTFGASKKKRHAPLPTAASSTTRAPNKRASEESTPSKRSGSDLNASDDAELVLDWSDDPSDQWQRSVASDSDSDDAPDGAATASSAADESEIDGYQETPQIIFCSRTHSQLTQFVNEIKRTPFADGLRCVSLGSRKNLCVHPVVSQLKGSGINDKCLDMQKSAGKKKTPEELEAEASLRVVSAFSSIAATTPVSKVHSSCPYLSDSSQRLFRDHVLAKVRDLEELHEMGSSSGICAYFGTRRAISAAHIITMPYPALLHRGTRESLGVRLAGNVVIVDEAHNLIESINDVHSAQVTLRELRQAQSQLSQYLEKYQNRLKRCNLVNVRQILDMLQSCTQHLVRTAAATTTSSLLKPSTSPAATAGVGASPASVPRTPVSASSASAAASAACGAASRSLNAALHVASATTSSSNCSNSKSPAAAAKESDPFGSLVGSRLLPLMPPTATLAPATFVRKSDVVPHASAAAPAPARQGPAAVPSSPSPSVSAAIAESPVSASSRAAAPTTAVMRINDLTFRLHMDNINLLRVVQYMDESEIVKKVTGFLEKYQADDIVPRPKGHGGGGGGGGSVEQQVAASPPPSSLAQSSLGRFKDFLAALSRGADSDGRVVVTHSADAIEAGFRYLMLNPAVHFQEVVDSARAVILCGGTMQPFEHFVTQLFSRQPVERVKLFSCGHVVPPENIQAFVMPKGPTGVEFEFTATRRTDTSMIEELGRCIANACSVVPGGVIAFFPSYAYENTVCMQWQASGIMARIANHKQIFREPRNGTETDALLTAYSECIQVRKRGAFLTSVVGGKMSEGLNFSDDLARCVVMVGMPYPNPKDPELMERMAYYDQTRRSAPAGESAPAAGGGGAATGGSAYYSNLCMRAVNQSVGRAIRHRNDYATILFADHRYSREQVRKQLPQWLQPRLTVAGSFGEVQRSLCTFFQAHKKPDTST